MHRPKGVLTLKNMESVTSEVYETFRLNHVLPPIKSKWPSRENGKTILIQHDYATPHDIANDPEVVAAEREGGWFIWIIFQHPTRPTSMSLI